MKDIIRIQNIFFSSELMGFEGNDNFVHDLSNSSKGTSNFVIYRLFCIFRNLILTDAQTPTSKTCDFYGGFRAQKVLSPPWKKKIYGPPPDKFLITPLLKRIGYKAHSFFHSGIKNFEIISDMVTLKNVEFNLYLEPEKSKEMHNYMI